MEILSNHPRPAPNEHTDGPERPHLKVIKGEYRILGAGSILRELIGDRQSQEVARRLVVSPSAFTQYIKQDRSIPVTHLERLFTLLEVPEKKRNEVRELVGYRQESLFTSFLDEKQRLLLVRYKIDSILRLHAILTTELNELSGMVDQTLLNRFIQEENNPNTQTPH